jgi:P27 family predicted phage terminase small subunit
VRGRKPRPTTLQIAEGDPRKVGVHKLEEKLKKEVKGSRGLPRCPAHLQGIARKVWKFWSEELEKMNLDCRPDAQMLEGACIAYETAMECYLTIKKQGRSIPKRVLDPETNRLVVNGLTPHPAVAQMNAALNLMRAFCSEFALSPASRSRIATETADDGEDELMEILSRPRERKPQPPIEVIE